jgi:hypothetical protein
VRYRTVAVSIRKKAVPVTLLQTNPIPASGVATGITEDSTAAKTLKFTVQLAQNSALMAATATNALLELL